jgi:hypothetical protein
MRYSLFFFTTQAKNLLSGLMTSRLIVPSTYGETNGFHVRG